MISPYETFIQNVPKEHKAIIENGVYISNLTDQESEKRFKKTQFIPDKRGTVCRILTLVEIGTFENNSGVRTKAVFEYITTEGIQKLTEAIHEGVPLELRCISYPN